MGKVLAALSAFLFLLTCGGGGTAHVAGIVERDLADGWTHFEPSADTRTVYVSPTGNDARDGLSPGAAKKTIAAGVALLRHGFPDWLLLERGGTWHEGLGHWKKSGRDDDEPMLVSSYGTSSARPRLLTGTQHGLYTQGGGGSPAHVDHLAVVGLEFVAHTYAGVTTTVGARMLQPSTGFLLEDCLFKGYAVNVVFQGFGGRHADFTLRRSVVVDAWAVAGVQHSQGLYAWAVDGLLVEENVFDHNGWKEGTPGAEATIFNHNLYIDNGNTGVVVRHNIVANASSHGMQLRCGGAALDNLFVRNSIALLVGSGTVPDPGGVAAEVHHNVILDGKDITPTLPRGWGLCLGNIASGNVTGNVIANNVAGGGPRAVLLVGGEDGGEGVHDTLLEGNVVFDWGGTMIVEGGGGQVSGVELLGNDLQDHTHEDPLIAHDSAGSLAGLQSADNRCFAGQLPGSQWVQVGGTLYSLGAWQALVGDATTQAQQVEYSDPARSPASWNALQGGPATLAAFLAQARLQGKATWRPEYSAAQVNAYLRGGFEPAP